LYVFLIPPMRATCPTNLIFLYLINNIWWSLQVLKFLAMKSSPASCHLLSLMISYDHQITYWSNILRSSDSGERMGVQ
jgi:hypothetical protein